MSGGRGANRHGYTSGKPHAVSSISGQVNDVSNPSFRYEIAGAVTQRLGYDAWGRRRQPNGTEDPSGVLTAKGITRGNRIYFRKGTYEPETSGGGVELLAHELKRVEHYAEGMGVIDYLVSARDGYSNSKY